MPSVLYVVARSKYMLHLHLILRLEFIKICSTWQQWSKPTSGAKSQAHLFLEVPLVDWQGPKVWSSTIYIIMSHTLRQSHGFNMPWFPRRLISSASACTLREVRDPLPAIASAHLKCALNKAPRIYEVERPHLIVPWSISLSGVTFTRYYTTVLAHHIYTAFGTDLSVAGSISPEAEWNQSYTYSR